MFKNVNSAARIATLALSLIAPGVASAIYDTVPGTCYESTWQPGGFYFDCQATVREEGAYSPVRLVTGIEKKALRCFDFVGYESNPDCVLPTTATCTFLNPYLTTYKDGTHSRTIKRFDEWNHVYYDTYNNLCLVVVPRGKNQSLLQACSARLTNMRDPNRSVATATACQSVSLNSHPYEWSLITSEP